MQNSLLQQKQYYNMLQQYYIKHKKIYSLLLIILFFSIKGFGQQKVCGIVLENTIENEPIAETHIWIENTLIGALSNIDGEFCIEFDSQGQDSVNIILSKIGYKSRTIQVVLNNTESSTTNKIGAILLTPETIILDEIVVTANKSTSSSQVSNPNVITKEKISESSVINIPTLFLKEPGLSLTGQSYHAAPSIRGLSRKRVVLLLDGEKVSTERNVGTPGTFIPPQEIERIEILKGPYSVLYGSDAIGGVINIISKNFKKPHYLKNFGGTINTTYQSVNNGISGNVSLNGKIKKLLFRFNAGYRTADNYKLPNKDTVQNTEYTEKHLGGKIQYMINKLQTITVKGYYSIGEDIGKPAYSTLVNAKHEPDNHYIAGLNYKIKNIGKALINLETNFTVHKHELGVIVNTHKQELYYIDDKQVYNHKYLESTDYIIQQNLSFNPTKNLKIQTGIDLYLRQNINVREHKIVTNYYSGLFLRETNDTLLKNASQNSYGFFLQTELFINKKLFTSGGIRWNPIITNPNSLQKSQKYSPLSGNIGVLYKINDKLSIKTNIGTAFRAPDIKELYITTNTPGGLNIGNDSLIPEQSLNLDISAIINTKNIRFELALFRYNIENMILLDWNDNPGNPEGTFRNIGKGIISGLELSIRQKISKSFSSYLNFTAMQGKDINNNDELPDIPPIQTNLGITFKKKQLSFTLSGRYSAKQTNVSEDDIENEAFFILNFKASWQILQNLTFYSSVSNMLNETYRDHFQFGWMNNPARSFNFGINFNF